MEKETGREFAAKIIDLGADNSDSSPSQMLEATRQEIAILRQVMGHPYISEYKIAFVIDGLVHCSHSAACIRSMPIFRELFFSSFFSHSINKFCLFVDAVELQDVFESDAFIFLVFELCRNGELFDYLTSVVTLSEKKTRYIMR